MNDALPKVGLAHQCPRCQAGAYFDGSDGEPAGCCACGYSNAPCRNCGGEDMTLTHGVCAACWEREGEDQAAHERQMRGVL